MIFRSHPAAKAAKANRSRHTAIPNLTAFYSFHANARALVPRAHDLPLAPSAAHAPLPLALPLLLCCSKPRKLPCPLFPYIVRLRYHSQHVQPPWQLSRQQHHQYLHQPAPMAPALIAYDLDTVNDGTSVPLSPPSLTSSPTTQFPAASPSQTTQSSTASPTTQSPTASPTTQSPTVSPTTHSPTASPTAQSPKSFE